MQPNPQETADLVTFTEEILKRKLHLLCSDSCGNGTTSKKYSNFSFSYNWFAIVATANIISVAISQPALTCSKLTIETLEQGAKYVQS